MNGEYIGYSSVSHCSSEFKLNLIEGKNEILVKVYKWCVGSYIEDQDAFRMNGIWDGMDCIYKLYFRLKQVKRTLSISVTVRMSLILICTTAQKWECIKAMRIRNMLII